MTSLWSDIKQDLPVFFASLNPKISKILHLPLGQTHHSVLSIPVYVNWNSSTKPVIPGSMLISNSVGKVNYPFAIYNLHDERPIYQCLCTVDSTGYQAEAVAICKKNIEAVFTEPGGIFHRGCSQEVRLVFSDDPAACYWSPFQPLVNAQQFTEGFYDTIEDQQGYGSLYYSNSFTYFNNAGFAAQYATNLVDKYFNIKV